MFLVIFKQPGANVIDTVDKIMAELPRIRASMPPSIDIGVLSDRTQTIRAAVHDVQFTLLLTIALVVMVIFVFLRSLWATVIPSVTVPLSLLGAFALMWAAGYTLDNLSLDGADDLGRLRRRRRHRHARKHHPLHRRGRSAARGRAEGLGQRSASPSCRSAFRLIAVLIPLLLMGGIIGRLFREFAVTLSMTIVVSAVVSLTLTPMMASRFLTPAKETHHGRLYEISERGFDALLQGYERGLDVVLQYRFVTLLVFLATLALTVYLFVIIPKGFFPQQDTGLITGISQAAQDISVKDMMRHQEALGEIVLTGSRRGPCGDGDRRLGKSVQYRSDVHHAEAAGPARRQRRSDHRAIAAAARPRSKARSCFSRRRRT